jgi:isocitrate dehydrogenase (NAD+)
MGMILAAAAVLHHAAELGFAEAERCSRAIYEAVLAATAAGIRTTDLGGHASTTEFTDEVIGRVRASLDPPAEPGRP